MRRSSGSSIRAASGNSLLISSPPRMFSVCSFTGLASRLTCEVFPRPANFDLFGQLLRQWKRAAVAARCRMIHSGNSKFSNPRPGWHCTCAFHSIISALSARENCPQYRRASPLPADQVSALIQAGRDVVRTTPWAVREQTALQ
jgi:hypothetical protein